MNTKYVICFKIDQDIFEILGFKVLKQESLWHIFIELWTCAKGTGVISLGTSVFSSLIVLCFMNEF